MSACDTVSVSDGGEGGVGRTALLAASGLAVAGFFVLRGSRRQQ